MFGQFSPRCCLVCSIILAGLSGQICDARQSSSEVENYQATEQYYRLIQNDNRSNVQANVAALNQFFALMPKGGDIHHHYSGAIYAETFLDWVASERYTINQKTLKVETTGSTPESLTVEQLRSNSSLYRQLLSKWSDKDFDDHYHDGPPPDEQFFNTFDYFGSLASRHVTDGLKKLKARALQENVQYLETMLSSVYYVRNDLPLDKQLADFQSTKDEAQTMAALDKYAGEIDLDPNFKLTVDGFVDKVTKAHAGIDDAQFTMRYQTYDSRNHTPSRVFGGLYAGFNAASQSELLVGVNIVGPENGVVAIRDYWLHMVMFKWLRNKFPKVHVAMHAGELTLGMVRPENLTFHIADAVRIAGAERIGHGVDIVYEKNSLALMQEMVDKQIAVEINLTSNEFILGVSGAEHPVSVYFRQGVPLVISTDDPGVSRNDLANEYMLMSTRYGLSYADSKKLVMNSIRFSFLSPADRIRVRGVTQEKFRRFEAKIAKQFQKLGR